MNNSNVITFGKNYKLKGSLSKPRGMDVSELRVGVIILGMGIAEVRMARQLKRLGLLVMQVRLIGDSETFNNPAAQRAIYDATGIERIQEAMDYLDENFGIKQFFLMGTCGGANVSLNTTVQDPRVVGLIPINLHFNELLTQDVVIKQKLRSGKQWKKSIGRLFSGKLKTKWLRRYLMAKLKRSSQSEVVEQWDWHKDMVVPVNLDERLEALTERGVNILMIYAQSEDSLTYLKKTYDTALEKLAAGGRFTLKVIETDTHVFSTDEVSATILNDIVNDWFENRVKALA